MPIKNGKQPINEISDLIIHYNYVNSKIFLNSNLEMTNISTTTIPIESLEKHCSVNIF